MTLLIHPPARMILFSVSGTRPANRGPPDGPSDAETFTIRERDSRAAHRLARKARTVGPVFLCMHAQTIVMLHDNARSARIHMPVGRRR